MEVYLVLYIPFLFISKTESDISPRIINGFPLDEGLRHPADVSLKKYDPEKGEFRHFCGGVVIHYNWVLTAAHCFPKGSFYLAKIMVNGVTYCGLGFILRKLPVDLLLVIKNSIGYHVRELHNYPCGQSSADLALLNTKERINWVKARLPPPGYEPRGNCQVCGYGTTQPHSIVQPNRLRCATVPIVDKNTCQNTLGYYNVLREGLICAGGGDTDACGGDSGSALHCWSNYGVPVLAGIVSYGVGCAIRGHPGVYTQVSEHINWIHHTMEGTWASDLCYVHPLAPKYH